MMRLLKKLPFFCGWSNGEILDFIGSSILVVSFMVAMYYAIWIVAIIQSAE